MQQKSLLILSGITVIALVVASLSLQDRDAVASPGAEKLLFPQLSDAINDIAQVRIEKAGKTVTLEKTGGGWTLADRGGYPAEFTKVKELAMRVAGLEIEETKTSKKANHAQLGVEWPPKKTAETGDGEGDEPAQEAEEPSEIEAGLVTLKDASGKELASLVIGKSEWRGSKPKLFARRAGEDQVYLCSPKGSGSFDVVPDAKSWIDPKFIELANDRVQSVAIEHADGERVEITRSAADHTQFALQGLAPGETERYQGVANGVAQALGYGLQLDDVRPAGEVDFAKEPLATTSFRCTDGLELVLQTSKFEDKDWVKVTAKYTPPPEPPKTEEAPAAEPLEGAEGEAKIEEPPAEKKDVGKEAAELNERLSKWAFAVPSFKTDVLTRHKKDLLAEPAPAAPTDAESLQGLLDSMGGDEMGGDESEPPMEVAPNPDDEGSAPASGDEPNDPEPK